MEPYSCSFGNASLNAPNPEADIVNRINGVLFNLSKAPYVDLDTKSVYTFDHFTDRIDNFLKSPDDFAKLAQHFQDAEVAIQKRSHSQN